VIVVPLTVERFAAFAGLIQSLADYEKLDGLDAAALSRLRTDAFAPSPRFEAVLVLDETGRAIGYAVWFETYSTFLARPTIYLEDLFILEGARHQGAGSLLFEHVRALGERRGCGRMDWQVLDWNVLAAEFYDRRGARQLYDWRTCRLTY
jgi:GNAT superfamily N-acetyltransferase